MLSRFVTNVIYNLIYNNLKIIKCNIATTDTFYLQNNI